MITLDIRVTVNTSAPYPESLVLTYFFAPCTKVRTMITEATPITTPIRVRMDRSLLPQRDSSASLKASISFMVLLSLLCPALPVYANQPLQAPHGSIGPPTALPGIARQGEGEKSRCYSYMDGTQRHLASNNWPRSRAGSLFYLYLLHTQAATPRFRSRLLRPAFRGLHTP